MKNQTQALEYASVLQYCKAVRLPTVGANFVPLAEQAVKENHMQVPRVHVLHRFENRASPVPEVLNVAHIQEGHMFIKMVNSAQTCQSHEIYTCLMWRFR